MPPLSSDEGAGGGGEGEEEVDVEHMLVGLGLAELWPLLQEEDILDIATLADMTRDDFKGMGITVGKASKIMRAVAALGAP
jgi:hypothetical protein